MIQSFNLTPQTVEWLRRLPKKQRSKIVNALIVYAMDRVEVHETGITVHDARDIPYATPTREVIYA